MIAPAKLFNEGPSLITDFASISSGNIFNEILPSFNSILEEGDRQREQELEQRTTEDIYSTQEDDAFLSQIRQAPVMGSVVEDDFDYNAPALDGPRPQRQVQPQQERVNVPQGQGTIKLSNYGYDSDSSPDRNSNVLRIGHSNNKLEDGVSAALTKSLAVKHGLKTGDYFEAVLADGTTLKRRYDDTVPTTYKGKPLPPTVDLYERKGSNSFGGKVITIKPL